MTKLRQYNTLEDLLTYETSTKNPQEAATRLIDSIIKDDPDFEILVIFVGPDEKNPWIILPIPSEALPNLDEVKISQTGDGRHPVAYWKRSGK